MPPFALPLDQNNIHAPARKKAFPTTTTLERKRKLRELNSSNDSPPATRASSADAAPSSEDEEDGKSTLSAAITNPLALSPEEIHQYKVAGAPIDQELDDEFWRAYKPHAGLGRQSDFAKDGPKKTVGKSGKDGKEKSLKVQHVGVLTAILHRCLAEGDIERANRAWALLLRTHVNGRPIELRESGFWGIGAELLIRAGEKRPKGRVGWDGRIAPAIDEDQSPRFHEEASDTAEESDPFERRWGTQAGLGQAIDYYDRLALQHPYRRQFSETINALDFYHARLGLQIYDIQYTYRSALHKLKLQETSNDPIADEEDDEINQHTDLNEDPYTAQQRWQSEREFRRATYFRLVRDELRLQALRRAEKVASEMDERMALPPFSDSHVLLRLRGMLCLYVGHLCLPEVDDDEVEGDEDRDAEYKRRERRLEYERCLEIKNREYGKARILFLRLKKEGVKGLDDVLDAVRVEEEDDESEEERSY